MRLTWGHQFILTSLNKLGRVEQIAEFFATLQFSHPLFLAYFVGYIELIGGFCLCVGFASRLAALPLAIIMLTALNTAHHSSISHFRFLFEPLHLVAQTPYPFLITALLVFFFGPGKISIDGWLKRWSENQPKY
jgi:putative oxidoreductase